MSSVIVTASNAMHSLVLKGRYAMTLSSVLNRQWIGLKMSNIPILLNLIMEGFSESRPREITSETHNNIPSTIYRLIKNSALGMDSRALSMKN